MNIRSGRPKRWVVIVVAIAVVFICGLIAVGPAYAPVKYGTVALIARFGKLTGQILEPGLHWRIPFVDQVVVVPTVLISYETSDNPESSGADYRDYPVTAQTIDGQQINIKYTVLFRIPASQTVNIVQNVGRPQEVVENVVKAHSRNLSRLWAQSHTAEDLYSGEGIFAYEDAVRNALQQEFDRYGVALDDFLVRKIDFGEEYINAIEQQQIAQEAIETARYQSEAAEYEKERQIRLAEAEAERTKLLAAAEAERTKLLAAADAERQRLLADAEAYGIEARGKALKQYPELTQWEFIRNLQNVEWGILPDTGITPLIPVPPSAGQTESPESP
ncbi:MAG TPA: SPFH domain-containing protein [Anaerolineae bacterium]|nr:SPFH domain-containing protein [Anaerolineae bacterium]